MTTPARLLSTVVALALAGACSSGPAPAPADELRAVAAELDPEDRFSFVYNAGGTRVTGCFQPNQSFVGEVDLDAGLLLLRREPAGPPIALVAEGRAILHASLFREGTSPTPWLTTEGRVSGSLRVALVRSLGPGLAGYVIDAALPPDGVAYAQESVTVAEEVTARPSLDGARRFSLRLDGTKLAPAGATSDEPLDDPTVEISIRDDVVRRIAVVPGRADGAGGDDLELGGWTIDYGTVTAPLEVPQVGPVTEIAQIDASTLVAPTIATCELPLSTEP